MLCVWAKLPEIKLDDDDDDENIPKQNNYLRVWEPPLYVRKQQLSVSCRRCFNSRHHRLAVWLSGNALASINVVALRQTRLVLGWVAVCGRVNHLGM